MPTPGDGPRCYSCTAALARGERVGRADLCAGCGAEVRACRNCAFFAPGAWNDCREPSAERVVDKERANFCDFFQLGASTSLAGEVPGARADLDALFRKG